MPNAPNKSSRYDQISRLDLPQSKLSEQFPELVRAPISEGGGFTARFPLPLAESSHQAISLEFLNLVPNLAEPFARAFVVVYRPAAEVTRSVTAVCLRTGWIAFLEETDRLKIELQSISDKVLSEYLAWLGRVVDGRLIWMPGTQKNKYRAVTSLVRALVKRRVPDFSLPSILRIPPQADPKKHYRSRGAIEQDSWEAIHKACVSDIRAMQESRNRWELRRNEAIQRFRSFEFADSSSYDDDLVLCFGALINLFENGIAVTRASLSARSPRLAEALYQRRHGPTPRIKTEDRDEMLRYFCPLEREDLVPYAIMFALIFTLNADTVRGLLVEDFSFIELMNVRRVRVDPFKGRARRDIIRTYVDCEQPDNPGFLYRQLLAWTSGLREFAHPTRKGLLLLLAGTDPAWPRKLDANTNTRLFAKRHGLTPFLLSNIRPTSIDIALLAGKGDIRFAQAAANHRTSDLTGSTYRSARAKRADEERLAEIAETRVRHIASSGKIDARRANEDQGDFTAATPGWTCFDPFSSPIEGQSAGSLCTAYGRCPICPLATTDVRSTYCAKRIAQLRDVIVEAATRLAPQRWMKVWAPVQKMLEDKWMTAISDSIRKKADNLVLSQLPMVE